MAENLQNMERHFIYKFVKFIDPPTNSPKVIFFKIHYDKTLKSKIKKNFKATKKIKFLYTETKKLPKGNFSVCGGGGSGSGTDV